MSPSDVQKITKSAMVERLKQAYGVDWFSETGALFQVDVSIRGDVVTVCVDSSGEPFPSAATARGTARRRCGRRWRRRWCCRAAGIRGSRCTIPAAARVPF